MPRLEGVWAAAARRAALQLLNEGLTQDPSNAYVRQAYAVLLEQRG